MEQSVLLRFGEFRIRFLFVRNGREFQVLSGLTTPASSKGKRSMILFLSGLQPPLLFAIIHSIAAFDKGGEI
jgi:hypothetical protein